MMLATQLTIIGLASAELRTRESETWNDNQTKGINTIETAVQETGNLIANLSRMLADKTAKKSNATPKRVLIRAGRLLDVRSGRVLTDQAILIEGDRIKEVGAARQIEYFR